MILHLVVMYKAVIAAVALVLLAPLAASSFATTLDVRIHSGSSSPYTSLTYYPPSVTGYVGHDAGDGNTKYDVQYSSAKDIVSSSVNTKDRSVNFVLVGKATAGSDLVLKLPKGLIGGPFLGVWVDNQQTKNFTITEEALVN